MFALHYNHKITQHFFFFTKRKPVLKEKQICSFGKAFLSKKRFLVKSRGFFTPAKQHMKERIFFKVKTQKTSMFINKCYRL